MTNTRALAGRARTSPSTLRSPVSWTLLGLLVGRAGYGHELLQRFEESYSDILPLGSSAQIYEALDSLEARGLVEQVERAPAGSRSRRLSKVRYCVTASGERAYQDWLVSRAREESQRSRVIMIQVAMLAPEAALRVIERYEETCLEEAGRASAAAEGSRDLQGGELAARLAREEERLAIGSRLSWIEYARRQFTSTVTPRSGRS